MDQETAIPTSFQALEISPQFTNRLKRRILFNGRSLLTAVLSLEPQLGPFLTSSSSYLRDGRLSEHSTWTAILFWDLIASQNTWIMIYFGLLNSSHLGYWAIIFLTTKISCSIGWGCRIHWLLLCRGVRHPPTSILDMTLNNLMMRVQ